MNFLITGAQMKNKGAQSLLFTIADQLRKRYGRETEISFLTLDIHKIKTEEKYDFDFIYCEKLYRKIDTSNALEKIWICGKEIIKHQLGKTEFTIHDIMKLKDVLKNIDAIIDVGGYSVSSKWETDINRRVFWYVETAKKLHIPVILMPQSFGPFEYGNLQEEMDTAIRSTLAKADVIFAREKQGEKWLKENYGLNNVELYTDIVLQCGNIEKDNIYRKGKEEEHGSIQLTTNRNVGIVPNIMTIAHGNKQHILSTYSTIIKHLLGNNYNVYIFRHSNDLELCKDIYEQFRSNQHVTLIENEFDCIGYSEFIKQFEFVIASRYHAIVHAYKRNVPALILGWAVKYQELAERFGQKQYVFDITNEENFDIRALLSALSEMEKCNAMEKERIRDTLAEIQKSTCFETCWKIIDKRV